MITRPADSTPALCVRSMAVLKRWKLGVCCAVPASTPCNPTKPPSWRSKAPTSPHRSELAVSAHRCNLRSAKHMGRHSAHRLPPVTTAELSAGEPLGGPTRPATIPARSPGLERTWLPQPEADLPPRSATSAARLRRPHHRRATRAGGGLQSTSIVARRTQGRTGPNRPFTQARP